MEFRQNEDFEDYLYDLGILDICFLQKIEPATSCNTSIPQSALIELLQVIESDLKAGSIAKYKKVSLRFNRIKKWNVINRNNTDFLNIHYCPLDFDFKESSSISFSVDIPAMLEVEADSVIVEEGDTFEKKIEPLLSDREFRAYVPNKEIPSPVEWINWCKEKQLAIAWRVWGDREKREPESLPYPDYSGFFLQFENQLHDSEYGLFFGHVCKENTGFFLSIENENEEDKIYKAVSEIFISKFPDARISCGNCELSTKQWLKFLQFGEVPKM